jgi:hypothetical protein
MCSSNHSQLASRQFLYLVAPTQGMPAAVDLRQRVRADDRAALDPDVDEAREAEGDGENGEDKDDGQQRLLEMIQALLDVEEVGRLAKECVDASVTHRGLHFTPNNCRSHFGFATLPHLDRQGFTCTRSHVAPVATVQSTVDKATCSHGQPQHHMVELLGLDAYTNN